MNVISDIDDDSATKHGKFHKHCIGTDVSVWHSARWLSQQDQPFQRTPLEVGVRDVARRDREALARSPRQEKVQSFDVAGWRVRPYTSGFLQISAVD